MTDSTVKSDLFALRVPRFTSLSRGQRPYEILVDERGSRLCFSEQFSLASRGFCFGTLSWIAGRGDHPSAGDVLDGCEDIYGL